MNSGTLPSWEESFVLRQTDEYSSSSDTFDYRQFGSSQWRSQEGKESLRAIQLSLDNKEGVDNVRKDQKTNVPIGLLSNLDRTLLGNDVENLSTAPNNLLNNSSYRDSRNENSKYFQKFDGLINRKWVSSQHSSREEDKQQSQRKYKHEDTQQKKSVQSEGHHEGRINSAFSSPKIPLEVGTSERKEEKEQQDIPKVDQALHNHFLEFLASVKPTTSASSPPTSSIEETAEGKSIHTNFSECKKVMKYLLRCLQGIKLSVDNDGDIKSKALDFYVEYETNSRYSLYIQSDDNWHHDLTDLDGGDGKESIEARSRVVRQESKRLLETFRESLSAIFDCCETRKAAYVAQIKKIRDVSNLATRNAMQTERLAGDSHIKHVTEMVETSQRRALDEAQQKLLESERMNRSLDFELQQLKNAVESYAVRDQRRLENQKQAVDEALRDQRESFEQTSKQQLQQAQDEARRAARDAAAQIDAINFNHKMRMEAQQAHEGEMKAIFAVERERIEEECKKLRQQLVLATTETCRERERAAARSQEDRERLDKLQQEVAHEASANKAQMQQQIVKILQDTQAEKNKMEGDLDTRMENFKQSILTAHALDIAKLQDSTLAEMKRIKAEAEVRYQEDARRVRHLHEQEMQRLLRENDRLRKIIIRNGGSSSFSNDAAASSSRQSPAVRTAFEERIRQGRSRSPAAGAPWSTSVSVSAATTSSSSGNHGSKGIAGNRRSIRKGSKSPTTSSAAPSSDNAGSSDSSSKGKHSMSKSLAYSPPPSPGPPPPPPPPPLLPAVEIGGTGKVLDWTTVRQSINDQHKILQLNGTPRKDTVRNSIDDSRLSLSPPPSSFPLDESLFTSKRSSSSSSASSSSSSSSSSRTNVREVEITTASSNAARVGSYMSRLEEYLQGNQAVNLSSRSFLRQSDRSSGITSDNEVEEDEIS